MSQISDLIQFDDGVISDDLNSDLISFDDNFSMQCNYDTHLPIDLCDEPIPIIGEHSNGQSHVDCIIELPCDVAIKNKVRLLVDTGATVSLIKVDVLKDETRIFHNKQIAIQGIFNNSNFTIGETIASLKINNSFRRCPFQVIRDTKSITTDGILGMDFLKNNAVINLYKNSISFMKTFQGEKESIDDDCINNVHTSIGERICKRMGYVNNSGLGKDGQGIREPVEIVGNKNRAGLGFAFKDTTDKKVNTHVEKSNEAIFFDFETMEEVIKHFFAIDIIDGPSLKNQQPINVINKSMNSFLLSPRSENIICVATDVKGDNFCKSDLIENNVYLANSVVRPQNGFVNLCLINANNTPVYITNFKPQFVPLNKYRVFSYHKLIQNDNKFKTSSNVLRYKLLMEQLIFSESLNGNEIDLLKRLFQEFNDIFHLPGDRLTCTNVTKFKLPLINNSHIVNRKQYRLPETYKVEVHKQVQQLLDDDIIEESFSPFNNPILLVPKKGVDDQGSKLYRLCVDFRELNKIAKPISFPLLRIEEILDKLGKSNYFSTLDLSKGFHQVEIVEEDREKTAFSTDIGHYQFKRCPFGLKTMPAFFQSLLNGILTGLQGIKCFIYLDDVVVFSKSLDEHYDKLKEIFLRLRETNLKLNPKKCTFLQKEILYLGHVCSKDGVKPDKKLLEAVKEYPKPVNVKQLQSFLGLANYYRKFIKDFSKIASPLHKLLNKNSKFDWDEKCKNAFENLKLVLTSPPVLAYPQFDKMFTITCDASLDGLGAVLEQDGHVISYASRSLLPAEKRWSTTELELNAIVFGCRTFNCYILGTYFEVFTDHKPLRGILKVKDISTRITHLQEKLMPYEFKIIYKKGKDNLNADCLSRRPADELCLAVTRAKLKNQVLSNDDPSKSNVSLPKDPIVVINKNNNDANKSNSLPKDPIAVGNSDNDADDDDDYEDIESPDDSYDESDAELVSDSDDKREILKAFHDNPLGGHFGVSKTFKRIRTSYKWKDLRKYVASYIKKCKKCQKNKSGRCTKMKLKLTEVSKAPFDKVFVDIVGPLPVSLNGNKYILSMVDDLTRFVEFCPMADQTADTVSRALFEQILCRYTIPKSIVTDNGSNFVGNVFKSMCKLLGVKKIRTTAYHPQANLVERQHSSLGNYLRNFVDGHPQNWDLFLRCAAHAYNNTPHSSTGFPPMELLFGFVSEIPTNLKRKPDPMYNFDQYKSELRYKLQKSFELARKNLLTQKEKSKIQYDKKASPQYFQIGDKVLIKNNCRLSKFSSHWKGPYDIVDIHDGINLTINQSGKSKRIHANQVKKFFH